MARGNRGESVNSMLGIIAVLVLIALAVYYVMREEDDDLEIDIGSRDVPVAVMGGSIAA
jgi:hypothetical protein